MNVLLLLAVALVPPSHAAGRKRVAILMSNAEQRYFQTRDAAVEQLRAAGFDESKVEVTVDTLVADKAAHAEQVARLVASNPDVYVPLGSVAAKAVAKEVHDRPIVLWKRAWPRAGRAPATT